MVQKNIRTPPGREGVGGADGWVAFPRTESGCMVFKGAISKIGVQYSLVFKIWKGSASVSSVVWCFAKLACFPISFCFPLEQPRLLPSPFPHVKRGEVEGESISFNARFPHISSTRFLEARFPSMKTSLFFLSSGCLVFLGQSFPFPLWLAVSMSLHFLHCICKCL